ncbi:hypothetical protein M885DRAFT_534987 [Pelagophyceae sp. CCMP2097]|nr:hypothetical protein M885DRAFT_534987 [Pelagophyceae sp. CCMP2097]
MVLCTKGKDKPATRPPPKGARDKMKSDAAQSAAAAAAETQSWAVGAEPPPKNEAERRERDASRKHDDDEMRLALLRDDAETASKGKLLKRSPSARRMKSEGDLASMHLLALEGEFAAAAAAERAARPPRRSASRQMLFDFPEAEEEMAGVPRNDNHDLHADAVGALHGNTAAAEADVSATGIDAALRACALSPGLAHAQSMGNIHSPPRC